MAWKFLSIKKANEEIARLESELTAKAGSAAAALPSPDQLASFEKRLDDLAASVSALGEQVATLESQTEATSDKFTVEIARLDKALADATPEKIGSRIAAEITSRQGQQPLAVGAAAASNNGSGDIEAQLQAIEDPVKRAQFFKTHEKELKARMNRNGHAAKK